MEICFLDLKTHAIRWILLLWYIHYHAFRDFWHLDYISCKSAPSNSKIIKFLIKFNLGKFQKNFVFRKLIVRREDSKRSQNWLPFVRCVTTPPWTITRYFEIILSHLEFLDKTRIRKGWGSHRNCSGRTSRKNERLQHSKAWAFASWFGRRLQPRHSTEMAQRIHIGILSWSQVHVGLLRSIFRRLWRKDVR